VQDWRAPSAARAAFSVRDRLWKRDDGEEPRPVGAQLPLHLLPRTLAMAKRRLGSGPSRCARTGAGRASSAWPTAAGAQSIGTLASMHRPTICRAMASSDSTTPIQSLPLTKKLAVRMKRHCSSSSLPVEGAAEAPRRAAKKRKVSSPRSVRDARLVR